MPPTAEPVLYTELQPYRKSPQYIAVAALSALFGWGLLVWMVLLDRPLGALAVPDAFVWVLWAIMGLAAPFFLLSAGLRVNVHPDRVEVRTGLAGNHIFSLDQVIGLTLRLEGATGVYKNQSLATEATSRTAYSVMSLKGPEILMRDGRLILIGSQDPEQLTQAIAAAWEPFRPAESSTP